MKALAPWLGVARAPFLALPVTLVASGAAAAATEGRFELGPNPSRRGRPAAAARRRECAQRGERHADGHRSADAAHAVLRRQRHAARGAALGARDASVRLDLRGAGRARGRVVRAAPGLGLRAADRSGRSRGSFLLQRLRALRLGRGLRRSGPRRAARLGRRLGPGCAARSGRPVGRGPGLPDDLRPVAAERVPRRAGRPRRRPPQPRAAVRAPGGRTRLRGRLRC